MTKSNKIPAKKIKMNKNKKKIKINKMIQIRNRNNKIVVIRIQMEIKIQISSREETSRTSKMVAKRKTNNRKNLRLYRNLDRLSRSNSNLLVY